MPGAIQVPPDGAPVLFLADHPVTGGYPVLAVVDHRRCRLPPRSCARATACGSGRVSRAPDDLWTGF